MGIGALMQEKDQDPGVGVMERSNATFTEVFQAGLKGLHSEVVSTSQFQRITTQKSERSKRFQELTGEELDYKLTGKLGDLNSINSIDISRPSGAARAAKMTTRLIDTFKNQEPEQFNGVKTIQDLKDRLVEKHIATLKQNEPEKYKSILTLPEIEKKVTGQQIKDRANFEAVARNASGFNKTAGSLASGVALSATDPVNILAMMLPGGQSRSLIRLMLREAAINAGAEVLTQPQILLTQRELGFEYGFDDALTNVGFAAILGGGFAGGAKFVGDAIAEGKISNMWRKISRRTDLSEDGKAASKSMERISHITENNPLKKLPEIDNGRHLTAVDIVSKKFEKGDTILADELPISQQEFDSIDTTISPDANAFERTRLNEVRKFQTESPVKPEDIPKQSVNTLPEQLLRKFQEEPEPKLRSDKLEPEELQMLDQVGIRPDKSGRIPKARVLKEFDRRVKNNEMQNLDSANKEHIEEYRAQRLAQINPDINPDVQARFTKEPTRLDEILQQDEPTPISVQEDVIKKYESPESVAAEQANFDRLVEENPNLKVFFEDKEVSLKNLIDEFEGDEAFQKEISTCAR